MKTAILNGRETNVTKLAQLVLLQAVGAKSAKAYLEENSLEETGKFLSSMEKMLVLIADLIDQDANLEDIVNAEEYKKWLDEQGN